MNGAVKGSERLQRAMLRAAEILYPQGEQDLFVRRLVKKAGSASQAITSAPQQDRPEAQPLFFAYSLVPEIARRILRERALACERVRDLEDLRRHIMPLYLGLHYECSYVLCLNEDGRLLRTEKIRLGTVDEAPFYLRVIAETVLSGGGENVILVHNHPGGSPEPSEEDCRLTFKAMRAMHHLGLNLIDHVILADGRLVSVRAGTAFVSGQWEKYAPLPEKYRGWPQ